MARIKLLTVKTVKTVKTAKAPAKEAGPGSRGWTGRGGGLAQLLPSVREYRGTTVQVCGLWPFSSGASSPMIGVPLGRHEETQATVCCDPISWFQRARLISNPSAFILGKPGLGKSTVVRRMFIGLSAQGVGARPLTVFRTVTLPLIIPGVLSGVVLAFLLTFDEAVVSLFLVSSRVRTLPIAMFDYVQTRTDPQLAAVSTLLIVLSLVIVVIIERIMGLRRVLR